MKKLILGLYSLALVFSLMGGAGAISFSDTQTLNVTFGEGPAAQYLLGETLEFSHDTPDDFEVPYDMVSSATIDISGYWIDSNKNEVSISGEAVGNLSTGGWWYWDWWGWHLYDYPSITNLDISRILVAGWSTGSPLEVSITTNGSLGDGILQLATSTFRLEYYNQTADSVSPAPVPEPSTVLLLGIGLLGLVIIGRRKFNPEQ